MSVRAYKIIKIEREKEPTFNCWHDDFMLNLAYKTNFDKGSGFLEFEKETIAETLKENKETLEGYIIKDSKEVKDLKNEIEVLESVLKDFGEEDYIIYECF